jgi:uncharacterized protein (TIGR03437 family)
LIPPPKINTSNVSERSRANASARVAGVTGGRNLYDTEYMFCGFFFFILAISANSVQPLASLPTGSVAQSVQLDSAGNIYVAGSTAAQTGDAFVAKLSPDGSAILNLTVLAGTAVTGKVALAVGSDGSAYVAGTTSSSNLPQAFAGKVRPDGTVAFVTHVKSGAETHAQAIAVDGSGRAFITGSVTGFEFPTTRGAIVGYEDYTTGFVVVFGPEGGRPQLTLRGFGGNAITLDSQGNIYAAGAFAVPALPVAPPIHSFPTTSGAYQPSVAGFYCNIDGAEFPCFYQHVAKIAPGGKQLLWGTFVSGQFGATPSAITLDADGNVILAGNTRSPDYPVTPRAYQTLFTPFPEITHFAPGYSAPAPCGYVTKLNAAGTSLLWSTFFNGSQADQITGVAADATGNIAISGIAGSSDLPGVWNTPVTSRALGRNGFVARLSANGEELSPTQALAPIPPNQFALGGVAVRVDGAAIVVPAMSAVAFSDFPRVTGIVDVDNTRLVRITPGQLLTLYGTKLSPQRDSQPLGPYPATWNGVTVTFNGIAAPILYASGDQVNLQVPYEVSGTNQVTMTVSSPIGDPPVSESFILEVVARQPSMVLNTANFAGPVVGLDECRNKTVFCIQPLALNADGSVNSRDNPAASGSVVTIFVNGLGVTTPASSTGGISQSQSGLTPTIAVACCILTGTPPEPGGMAVGMDTIAGSGTSLAQVRIQVFSNSAIANGSLALLPLAIDSTPNMDITFDPPPGLVVVRGLMAVIFTSPAK